MLKNAKAGKKIKFIKIFSFFIFIPAVFFASSCMLLPVEEEPLPPPVIGAYESAAYQFAVARVDTLVQYVDASAQRIPAREESLAFEVQALIKEVYVETGTFVEEGDLIAELEKTDLERRLDDALYEMSRLELRRRHAEETYLLGKKYEKVSFVDDHAYERTAADFVTRMQILRLDIEKIHERITERFLYSTMDGSVTYVKRVKDGDRSIEKERFVTISDTTVSVFIVTGMNAQYFIAGDTVQMKMSGSDFFDIVVADAEEIGVYNPGEAAAYFALTDIPAELMNAKYATVRYIIEVKEDVLSLPGRAVNEVQGVKFVYMLNEENVREQVTVETGMVATNGNVEILSGLKDGDSVILP